MRITGSPRSRRLLLALAAILYLTVALYLSRVLMASDDEESYLGLGRLLVTGAISLFQDDATGQRMPLPFYVLGASQVVLGRSLWAGRLLSIVIGLGVLAATVAVARRLRGDLAGVLAGFLLASQGVVVGEYATAAPRALTALIFMTAVWVFLRKEMRWRCALGMAAASVIFFTRTNMFPAIPFFFGWALLGADTHAERLAVGLVAAGPPIAFFLSDPRHLKLLAHVPLLHRFVEPLGYRSILSFSAFRRATTTEQLLAFPQFARRYESWAIGAVGVGVAAIVLATRQRVAIRWIPRGDTATVAGLGLWVLLWHYVIFSSNFKHVLAYFADFAPLGAVLLGVGFAHVWHLAGRGSAVRVVLAVALAAALTVSLVYIRHPLMSQPVPVPFRNDAIQRLDRAVGQLRALVAPGERVFLFSQPIAAYLAGLEMPLQHIMSPGGTLAPAGSNPRTVERSGVWGLPELERWLGTDARYAVVSERLLEGLTTARPEAVARIRQLLRERFVLIGRIGDAPWLAAEVYRRGPKESP